MKRGRGELHYGYRDQRVNYLTSRGLRKGNLSLDISAAVTPQKSTDAISEGKLASKDDSLATRSPSLSPVVHPKLVLPTFCKNITNYE